MTQKHVDLLLKALAVPEEESSTYLCDRIGFVSGRYKDYPEFIQDGFEDVQETLCTMIRQNIDHEFSFDDSFYAREGMTREQWVKEILVPIALKLK
jgi:hypothetical protein